MATNTVFAERTQDWSWPAGRQLIESPFTDVLPPLS